MWLQQSKVEKTASQQEIAKVIDEIGNLDKEGKQSEADKKIADLLADPATPNNFKFILYRQQGTRAMSKGDTKAAAESYEKAFAIKSDYEIAQSLGAIWLQAGDKQKAISFYRKAIELMPSDLPVRDDEIRVIEEQIKMIEEGKA